MKNIHKIVYLTGTRAEYGLMKPTLRKLNEQFNLGLIVTGTHLSKKYGYTINEIKKDKFKIVSKIKIDLNENDLKFMADSIGRLIPKISAILDREKPHLVLIEGDRGEQLAMAIVSSTMNIPVAHTSGGVVSKSIDDSFRNAITKLSHIHLAPTKNSAKRIIKMNEEPWRVHVVGPPMNLKFKNIDVYKKFVLNRTEPIVIVLQHTVSSQFSEARRQIRETLKAIMLLKYQTVVIYPNSDAGSNEIINEILKLKNLPYLRIYQNLENDLFMNLMSCADVLVGNSSAGIVEAPFFKLPVVNIGIRQKDREHGDNVINVSHNKREIVNAIKLALSKNFRKNIKKNPYKVFGKTENNIFKIISTLKIDSRLLVKKPIY